MILQKRSRVFKFLFARSPYDEDRLRAHAAQIAQEVSAGRPVWCMFDNTAASAALANALSLKTMCEAIDVG